MKKITFIISLCLMCKSAFSADVPIATDAGTITVNGSVYTSACTTVVSSVSLVLPTTFATAYSAKGDMSPLGKSALTGVACTGNTGMSGVYITVTGEANSTEPTLFKIPEGTGKATGVALKLYATSSASDATTVEITPNKESAIIPKPTSNTNIGWIYSAQVVSVADTVTSGDLATSLTWTARYN